MNRLTLITVILLLLPELLFAKVEFPSILCNNMVLQRETTVNLWGKAEPNSKIRVKTSWNNKNYKTETDEQGNWQVEVITPEAGGPYNITVSDGDAVVLDNILIGDVWICAGQSNMEMPMIGFWGQPISNSAETIVKSVSQKKVRFATIERQTALEPMDDCVTSWCVPSMKTTPSFCATGYFFASMVADATDIPIGVINVSWGSARMESFMTKEAILNVVPEESYFPSRKSQAIQTHPEAIFNGMMAPITKFKAKGFIWDQGAANRFDWKYYADLTVEMVTLWRTLWEDNNMPFYCAQSSHYAFGNPGGIEMPLIMEAQAEAVEKLDNAYLIPTADIQRGVCPHYPDKDILGERIAIMSLVKTYGMDSEMIVDAPRIEDILFDGARVSVFFDNDDYGLCPRYEPIIGFELAGKDKVFHKADASLNFKKKCVEVTCKEVEEPVAVRYAFRNEIKSNLTNIIGWPAYPFRSDDWEPVLKQKSK